MAESTAKPVAAPRATDDSKTTTKKDEDGSKLKKRLGDAFGYIRLLVSADPTPVDLLLLVTGIIFSMTAGVPYPLMAILFGELVDELNSASCRDTEYASSAPQSVNNKVLMTVYISIGNFMAIYIATSAWSLFGERLVRRLRASYLRTLLKQEVSYFETLPPGEVTARLDTDLRAIQAGVCEKAGIVIQSVSYFVTAYVVALIKDAPLAGMLFSLVPVYLLMVFGGNFFSKKYNSRLEGKSGAANSIASEALSNMKLVKAFGAAKRIETIFADHLSGTTHAAIGKIVTAATQMGLLYFVAYASSALAISQGGRQIAESIEGSGSVTVGTVYALMLTLVDASYILCNVAPFLQLFAAASQSADKLFSTMYRASQIDGSHQATGEKLSALEGKIEFRDVSFRYPARKEVLVLDSLDLDIPAGKTTGIVGLSGSGKSTVASLAERMYDPESGTVLIDGRDARELHARHLRGHMAIVEQNPVLLDRSILENVAHGLVGSSKVEHVALESVLTDGSLHDLADAVRKGGDIDQLAGSKSQAVVEILALVRQAALQSSASIFIEGMTSGLATLVGPGGGQLSGGQKQRVALARALVRNPAVLILDEATASLDSTTEAQIQNALETLPGSRTVICVAHRLSTVKNADKIIVMEAGGKVVEQGTYDELMTLNGVFASMVKLQTIDVSSHEATPRRSSVVEISGDIEKVITTGKGAETHDGAALVEISDKSDTGAALKDKDVPKRSFLSTFTNIIILARRQLLFMVFGVLAAAIIGGAHSGEAFIFGHAVSSLNTCRTSSQVRDSAALYGLLFFILAIVEFLANVVSSAAFGWVSDKLVRRVRTMVLHTLLRHDLHWHESDGRTPGTLMSYLSADATAMSGLTGVVLGVTFSVLVTLIAGIVLSHVIAWKVAVVILACVPLVFLSGMMRMRLQAQFAERHAKAFANSVGIATEAVSHIRTISAYSLQDEAFNSFIRSLRGPYKATLHNIGWGNLWLASAFSVGPLTNALAYWWAAQLIARREINQTQFLIVLISLLAAAQTCGTLFSLSPDITGAAVAARRVLALVMPGSSSAPNERAKSEKQSLTADEGLSNDVEKAVDAPTQKLAGNPTTGMSIAFRNISFSYPTRPEFRVLDNVSFNIRPGSFVAFVGASGAGKSTIMSLLERFYLPSSGTISLDGQPLPSHYRSSSSQPHDLDAPLAEEDYPPILDSIALVPQDPVLFSGTLAFNLSLGAPPSSPFPSQAALERAARLANVHDTIASLPQKYETAAGPQGSQSLSGGQKQRVCIARALVREPRLLLLDEPTSALDAESESAWEEALEGVRREGKVTVVAIAHRLRTVIKADKIFVMEHGRIVAEGTHAELVESSEIYRRDVMLQTLG